MTRQKFPKSQRLKSNKKIQKLFVDGKTIRYKQIILRYLFYNKEVGDLPKTLFIIPKKALKNAAHRNKIKRQLREAYRINKEALRCFCEKKSLLLLGFIYYPEKTQKKNFSELMLELLGHLQHQLSRESTTDSNEKK